MSPASQPPAKWIDFDEPAERFGHYRFVREVGATVGGIPRVLALNEPTRTSHAVYRLAVSPDQSSRRRVASAIDRAAGLRHPHILPIERWGFSRDHHACVIAPYTGTAENIVTLRMLGESRGQAMSPPEAGRALDHILSAVATAHAAGLAHGEIDPDEVLVDRFGQCWIELYGLRNLLRPPDSSVETLVRDEVRSVVAIGRMLLDPPPQHLIGGRGWTFFPKLPMEWRQWLRRGLDPVAGFTSAAQALAELPVHSGAHTTPPGMDLKTLWKRAVDQLGAITR